MTLIDCDFRAWVLSDYVRWNMNSDATKLFLHGRRVDLAHVATSIFFLNLQHKKVKFTPLLLEKKTQNGYLCYLFDYQTPGVLLVMSDQNPRVVGYDLLVEC